MSSRSRNLPAEERRTMTIAAVLDLAATQNPNDITTAAIAERVGLTHGALFRHFPDKDAIWAAVMAWVAETLLRRIEHSAAGVASPLAAMAAMFAGHVDFVRDYPGVPRILFGELQRAESTAARRQVQELLQRYRERLQRLIAAGIQAGELAPDLDANAAAALFIGSVQGLVMQSLLAGDVERMRLDAPRVWAIYSRGIGSVR